MTKIGKNTKLYLIGMIIGGITLGITTVIADTIINSTSVAYKTTTVKAALDELYDIADFKEEVKDMLYPVGSIYISVSSTNPSELFGGTWVSFGMGRTLMGVGTVEANNNTWNGNVEAGEYVRESSEIKGGEMRHTLTENEMPTHKHEILLYHNESCGFSTPGGTTVFQRSSLIANTNGMTGTCVWGFGYTGTSGSSYSHNNIQPYITVFMWKRTA